MSTSARRLAFPVGRNTVRDTIAGGSACGVIIDCAITRPTTRRTNFYTGLHQVFVSEYAWWGKEGETCECEKRTKTAHAEFRVEDPGTTSVGYLWWSAELVYKAAESATAKSGTTGIWILVAPDTEEVMRKCVAAGKARRKPEVTSPATRQLVVGTLYNVVRTLNGGPWKRDDGTLGTGWCQTAKGDYIPALKLEMAP